MNTVLEPITFGKTTFVNNVARSATNDYMGNPDGTVSALQMKLYKQLCEGGVGMIITGHIAACPGGRNDPNQNALWDDAHIESHRALCEMVHGSASKIVAQINHSGAKSQKTAIAGEPVGPSAVEVMPGSVPHALTLPEMQEIKAQFTAAALRAQKAGYDGVQIHCAHGYLLSQFIEPAHNIRTDAYGGPGENRFRFAAEIIQAVKQAVGADYPVFLKINCNTAKDDDVFADELVSMMQTAKELGVAAAEISGFDFPKQKPKDRLFYMERACRVRRETGLPVILVGGVRTPDEMEQALESGLDMVSLSRPFICQPDILLRLKAGEVSACIGCFGCFSSYQKQGKRCVLHKVPFAEQ